MKENIGEELMPEMDYHEEKKLAPLLDDILRRADASYGEFPLTKVPGLEREDADADGEKKRDKKRIRKPK